MGELNSSFSVIEDSERRSTIERVVTSYRHPWDILTELTQNAVDAINDQADEVSSGEFLGELLIEVASANRKIVVTDNGIGIPAEKIGTLVATSKSLKRDAGKRYGFMGFGLTFVAFQTSLLKIESVHDGKKSVRTYHDLYRYVFGDNPIALPEADEDGTPPTIVSAPNGTVITAIFPVPFPREDKESDLDDLFTTAKNPDLFAVTLRTKTAVGNVQEIFGKKPVAQIVCSATVDGSKNDIPFKYLDYTEVLAEMDFKPGQWKSLDAFNEVVAATKDDTPEMQHQKLQYTAILHKLLGQSLGDRKPLRFDMYIFATSKEHITRFNRKIGAEKDAEEDGVGWGVSTGILLSIDGMPTSIRLDPGMHPDFLPFSALIDVRGISQELDAGRKGISTSRRDQLVTYVKEQLLALGFRKYAKYVTRSSPANEGLEKERDTFKKRFEESKNALWAGSAIYVPLIEEQEVIALFFELVGSGKLHGYSLKMLSGYHTYDALMDYVLDKSEKTLYDREKNRLGILPQTFERGRNPSRIEGLDRIVEFKQNLALFYHDILRFGHTKNLEEIDLLVCWSIEPNPAAKVGDSVAPIAPSERNYFGATHRIIMTARRALEVMALEDVLKTLA